MSEQRYRNTRLGVIAVTLLAVLSGCARFDYGPAVRGGEERTGVEAAEYAAAPAGSLRVQPGENLYAIAKRHGIPLRQLIDVNRLRAPYVIHPGQLLRLPRGRYHIVRPSETVYAIANRYDVDMGSLVRINRIEPPYRVEKGQKLRLPDENTRISRVSRTLVPRSVKGPGTLPATPPRREAKLTPRWSNPGTGPLRNPPKRSAGKFLWPVRGRIIVDFGPRKGGYRNDGINIAASKGTAIRAVENGVVAYTGNQLQGFGNLVLIKHSGRWMSAYAHGSVILVKRGQIVRRGQIIARVGTSGNVTRPQLHFELRRGDEPVDPKRYLVRFAWALPLISVAFLDVPPGPE